MWDFAGRTIEEITFPTACSVGVRVSSSVFELIARGIPAKTEGPIVAMHIASRHGRNRWIKFDAAIIGRRCDRVVGCRSIISARDPHGNPGIDSFYSVSDG